MCCPHPACLTLPGSVPPAWDILYWPGTPCRHCIGVCCLYSLHAPLRVLAASEACACSSLAPAWEGPRLQGTPCRHCVGVCSLTSPRHSLTEALSSETCPCSLLASDSFTLRGLGAPHRHCMGVCCLWLPRHPLKAVACNCHCACRPAGFRCRNLAWNSSLAVQAVSFQEICQGCASPVCIDMAPSGQAAPSPRSVQIHQSSPESIL